MKNLRRAPLALLVLLVIFCAGCSTSIGGTGTGTSTNSSGFPTNAAHPQPKEITFQGCPPQGDGGDAQLNMQKNRVDDGENGSFHDVSLATLLSLQWPQDVERKARSTWSSSDQSAVDQYEGVAVRTTGYILGVRHEGTESPNCHDVDHRDFHIWLAVSANDTKDTSMVVEVTPRVRDMRPGWTDSALQSLTGKHVRISGWLMLDQEHPEQLAQTRETLFEIHPIMHIEVDNNGSWASIDS
ncbi:MAG TPA: hypothetical protein VFA70_14950 [Dehalococcoidia bacterium]|nr:hypothetical protein [Dehalococcoidia bacterium]